MAFFQALEGLFSIIIMVSLGYYLTARNFLNHGNASLLAFLVNYVALPPFMIWSMLNTFDRARLLPLLAAVVVPAISMLIAFAIGYVLSILLRIPTNRRGIFRSAFFSSSAIFVGLPVNLTLFGESSVPYVLVYFLANAFLFWTVGNYSISLSGKSAPTRLISLAALKQVFSPPFIGFCIAFLLVMLGISLPNFLMLTFRYLGGLTTPLSMLFIGFVMCGVNLRKIRLTTDLAVLLAGRFIIAPLIVFFVADFFPIPELMKKVFVIQSALPAMTQTTLMAKFYEADTEYAALLVSTTTLMAVIAIPVYMVLI